MGKSKAKKQQVSLSEGQFGSPRGLQLHYKTWTSNKVKPRAIALLNHGLGEHSGRYAEFATALCEAGFIVVAHDHESHGKSDGPKESPSGSFEDIADDSMALHEAVLKDLPDLPHFLIGHSMGGLVTILSLLKKPEFYSRGAVICAPCIGHLPPGVSSALYGVAVVLSKVAPGMRPKGIDLSTLTRDEEIKKAYVDDPLVWHLGVTTKTGNYLIKAMRKSSKNADKITTPYLLIQGLKDNIVDPVAAQEWHAKTKSTDRRFVQYPDLVHELLNEPERKHIYAEVIEWLLKRLDDPKFSEEHHAVVTFDGDGNPIRKVLKDSTADDKSHEGDKRDKKSKLDKDKKKGSSKAGKEEEEPSPDESAPPKTTGGKDATSSKKESAAKKPATKEADDQSSDDEDENQDDKRRNKKPPKTDAGPPAKSKEESGDGSDESSSDEGKADKTKDDSKKAEKSPADAAPPKQERNDATDSDDVGEKKEKAKGEAKPKGSSSNKGPAKKQESDDSA